MVISMVNRKGGVGKTPIAFNLAKDLGLNIITNDSSILTQIYSLAVDTAKPKFQKNTVFDFGGFNADILDIIDKTDIVIVPLFFDRNAAFKSIFTIKDIYEYKQEQEFIAVVTKLEDPEEFIVLRNGLLGQFKKLGIKPKVKFLQLRKSKIFSKSMESGESIREIVNKNKFNKYVYRNILEEYELLHFAIKSIMRKVKK